MSVFEKVFGGKPERQTPHELGGGFGASDNGHEGALMFFEEPLAVGQVWKTRDGRFTLSVVAQKKNSGRFDIVLKDGNEETPKRQRKNSEEIKALLMSDGYVLASAAPVVEDVPKDIENNEDVPSLELQTPKSSEKTISLSVHYESTERIVALDEEFSRILEEVTGKIEVLAEIIHVRREQLGDDFYEFESMLRAREAAVNKLVEEDERLLLTIEGAELRPDEAARVTERQEKHIAELKTYGMEADALQEKVKNLLASRENVIPIKEENVLTKESPIVSETPSPSQVLSETKKVADREMSPEIMIGEERYAALAEYIQSVWKMFQSDVRKKKIPKKIWKNIWQEEALSELRQRVSDILSEQGIVEPEVHHAVFESFLETLPNKK